MARTSALYAPHVAAVALTANGGTDGYATVASNAAYAVGATVWIISDTEAALEGIVTDLSGATKIGFRAKPLVNRGSASYGRTSLAAYLTADNAKITQEAGVVPPTLY